MRGHLAKSIFAGLISLALAGFGLGAGFSSSALAAGSTQQTITHGPLPSVAQVNQSFSMSATSSSGLPVDITMTGSPVTVCNASQSSYFVVEAVGTCLITFEQPGDSTFAAAPTISVSITVEGAQQLITAAPAMYVPIGGSGQITATSSAGLALQYAVVSMGAPNCSVTSRGRVTGLAVGPCTVLLNSRASSQFSAATSVNQSVWVTALPEPPPVLVAPPALTPSSPADSGDTVFMLDEEATKKLKPSLDAKDVVSTTGGLMVFKGRNLLSIEKVFVAGNIPVKIVTSSDAAIELELPKASLVGSQAIKLQTSLGEKLYEAAVNYLAAPVSLKPVIKVLKGFTVNQAVLTKSQKASLKAFVKSIGKYKLVECRGVTKPIYLTCKHLKLIYKAGRVKVTKLKLKVSNPVSRQVSLVFSR